jgi:Domain of unknown function (DU1801)
VKLTFAKGAALKDPSGLFNSSLEGNVRRAIDFHEDEMVNEKAVKALVRAAVTVHASKVKRWSTVWPEPVSSSRRPARRVQPVGA